MYIAKVGFAGPQIVGALEITPDLDAGADKATLLRALPDPDVSGHRHAAFEKRKRAVIGVDIAVDRRRLLRGIDSETGILQNVNVPGDGCIGQGARRAVGDDYVAIDRSRQSAGAGRVSSPNRRSGSYERRNRHDQSVNEPPHSLPPRNFSRACQTQLRATASPRSRTEG